MKKDNMNEQGLAGKIRGWLPSDNYDLDTIANKLRFIGLSLSCSENVDGMEAEDFFGPGEIILELVKELRGFDRDYTTLCIKLSELSTGIKSPNNGKAPGPTQNADSGA